MHSCFRNKHFLPPTLNYDRVDLEVKMSGYERVGRVQDYRVDDRAAKNFVQCVEDTRGTFDFNNSYTNDTAAKLLCALQFFDSERPKDIQTKAGRTFEVAGDGSIKYKMTQKDRNGLYDTTTDYLTKMKGRQPTAQEVRDLAQKIAQANGIRDINNIRVGTELRIPGKIHPGQRDYEKPQPPIDQRYGYPLMERSEVPPRVYDTRIGVAPPDKFPKNEHTQPPGTEPDSEKKFAERTRSVGPKDQYGRFTEQYEGELKDGQLWSYRTKFRSEDKTDSEGRLIQRKITYLNPKSGTDGAINMNIPKVGAGEENIKVKQMEIQYNPITGNYHTTITGPLGETYHLETNRDGKTIRRR